LTPKEKFPLLMYPTGLSERNAQGWEGNISKATINDQLF